MAPPARSAEQGAEARPCGSLVSRRRPRRPRQRPCPGRRGPRGHGDRPRGPRRRGLARQCRLARPHRHRPHRLAQDAAAGAEVPAGPAGAAGDPAELPAADAALAVRLVLASRPVATSNAPSRRSSSLQRLAMPAWDTLSARISACTRMIHRAAGSSSSTTAAALRARQAHFDAAAARSASPATIVGADELRQMEPGLSDAHRRRAPSSRTPPMSPTPACSREALFDAAIDAGRRPSSGPPSRRSRQARRPASARGRGRRSTPTPSWSRRARGRSRSRPVSATTCRSTPSAATMSASPA